MKKPFHASLICLIVFFAVSLASCDSDGMDNNNIYESKYESVVRQIVTPDGESRFPTTDRRKIILLGCETEDIAEGLVSAFTLRKYNDESSVILDLGDYGQVSATRYDGTDQRYFRIEVDVKGYDRLRLMLVSVDYLNNMANKDNDSETGTETGNMYRCPGCGAFYTYLPEECPVCKCPIPDDPIITLVPIPSFSMDEVDVNFDLEVSDNG